VKKWTKENVFWSTLITILGITVEWRSLFNRVAVVIAVEVGSGNPARSLFEIGSGKNIRWNEE